MQVVLPCSSTCSTGTEPATGMGRAWSRRDQRTHNLAEDVARAVTWHQWQCWQWQCWQWVGHRVSATGASTVSDRDEAARKQVALSLSRAPVVPASAPSSNTRAGKAMHGAACQAATRTEWELARRLHGLEFRPVLESAVCEGYSPNPEAEAAHLRAPEREVKVQQRELRASSHGGHGRA